MYLERKEGKDTSKEREPSELMYMHTLCLVVVVVVSCSSCCCATLVVVKLYAHSYRL